MMKVREREDSMTCVYVYMTRRMIEERDSYVETSVLYESVNQQQGNDSKQGYRRYRSKAFVVCLE